MSRATSTPTRRASTCSAGNLSCTWTDGASGSCRARLRGRPRRRTARLVVGGRLAVDLDGRPAPASVDEPSDTFFVGGVPGGEAVPLDVRDPQPQSFPPHRGRDGSRPPQEERRRRSDGVGEHGNGRARLSGITVKMLVDQRLDAQLSTMFMVAYAPGGVAHPHDHPSEESTTCSRASRGGRRRGTAHAAPRRCLLDGRRHRPRLLRNARRARSLARDVGTAAAEPPLYRFERDWDYLRGLIEDADGPRADSA